MATVGQDLFTYEPGSLCCELDAVARGTTNSYKHILTGAKPNFAKSDGSVRDNTYFTVQV